MTKTLLINGEWKNSSDGAVQPVINPANGKTVSGISKATVTDVQAALQAAADAFPIWAGLPARERARIMHEAMSIFRRNLDEIAKTLTLGTRQTAQRFAERMPLQRRCDRLLCGRSPPR